MAKARRKRTAGGATSTGAAWAERHAARDAGQDTTPKTVKPPASVVRSLKKIVRQAAGAAGAILGTADSKRSKVIEALERTPIEFSVPGYGSRQVGVARYGDGDSAYAGDGESSWHFTVELPTSKRNLVTVPLSGIKLYMLWQLAPGDPRSEPRETFVVVEAAASKPALAAKLAKVRASHLKTHGPAGRPYAPARTLADEHTLMVNAAHAAGAAGKTQAEALTRAKKAAGIKRFFSAGRQGSSRSAALTAYKRGRAEWQKAKKAVAPATRKSFRSVI